MEKKGTKIAYFVACAVFVVLLVVLGISFKGAPLPEFVIDGETVQAETPFAGTFWSLLPPIVAIVLALISKEGTTEWCAEYDEWGNLLNEENPHQLQQLVMTPTY